MPSYLDSEVEIWAIASIVFVIIEGAFLRTIDGLIGSQSTFYFWPNNFPAEGLVEETPSGDAFWQAAPTRINVSGLAGETARDKLPQEAQKLQYKLTANKMANTLHAIFSRAQYSAL